MKLLLRILLGLAILVLAFVVVNIRLGFRTSDAKTEKYFQKRNVQVHIRRTSFDGGELRWVETGGEKEQAPLIVFVHGAPGSANNFHRYLADSALLTQAVLVSIDRPGYGYSQYGRAVVSLARQAAAVKAVMDTYGSGRKVILVGHSFGGPVIAKAAMDYPDRLSGILMLAPVNDPENEQMFWFSHFARWKATRWMLSPAWQVSGDEKFSHAAELAAIADGWKTLRVPVVHMHGDKDSLAPPVNADFSERQIPAEYLRLVRMPGVGHLIPFLNFGETRDELWRLLAQP